MAVTPGKSDTRRLGILRAARDIFIREGYRGFTMRKVAAATGISLGNLNYHFPRKDALLKALLEHLIDGYVEEFERRRSAAGDSPLMQFEAVVSYWLDDLLSRDTTAFFPELWALSNHDPQVAAMTDALYQRARQPLTALIPLINPRLDAQEVEQRALAMCAAMEGLTIFAGHDKPWAAQHHDLKAILLRSFLKMIDD